MGICSWMRGFWLLAIGLLLLPGAGNAQAAAPEGVKRLAQLTFCVPPQVWSKRRKRCVNPFVKTQVKCRSPRIWSVKQKRCVFPVVDDARCGRREQWSTSKDACVCRGGYQRAEGKCVRIVPAANTGPDLAEIQACLNELGYKAGAVDGRPGQRTRGAWNDFREDKGLGGPTRNFNDTQTLERLFQECDAKDSETAAAPKADDKPKAAAAKPEPAEKPTAAAGYPGVLCVSKSLHKSLSKIAGKAVKLEVCGEACVPIPPGTSPASLASSEQEYAVKWCRNCIQVGGAGLICGESQ